MKHPNCQSCGGMGCGKCREEIACLLDCRGCPAVTCWAKVGEGKEGKEGKEDEEETGS